MFTLEESKVLLDSAHVFLDLDEDEDGASPRSLNMSDTWGWACADSEDVDDKDLPYVAELFWRYGYCGLLYWVSERHNFLTSEFYDINRFIQFVREEEALRREIPSGSDRAYTKKEYLISN